MSKAGFAGQKILNILPSFVQTCFVGALERECVLFSILQRWRAVNCATCQLLQTDGVGDRILEQLLFVKVGLRGKPNTQRAYSLVFSSLAACMDVSVVRESHVVFLQIVLSHRVHVMSEYPCDLCVNPEVAPEIQPLCS